MLYRKLAFTCPPSALCWTPLLMLRVSPETFVLPLYMDKCLQICRKQTTIAEGVCALNLGAPWSYKAFSFKMNVLLTTVQHSVLYLLPCSHPVN